mmetsp:Transcript_19548/g.28264  ORF Transcript_19548/g.28264 Transcript_19548/m.28264 type:complete len:325 (+) Transcript_19548:96-1070(+)
MKSTMLFRNGASFVLFYLVVGFEGGVSAFLTPLPLMHSSVSSSSSPSSSSSSFSGYTVLEARKKRRRKNPVPDAATSPIPGSEGQEEDLSEEDIAMIQEVANFEFKSSDPLNMAIENDEPAVAKNGDDDDDLTLPDIKDVMKTKQLREEIARMEEEDKESRPRIKRSDREAFVKLYSSQPFADADSSFFEVEEYGVVSALLGENAASFLGIPPGPLQVGHFIGALGIALMAFVEYPGFPLTNLPTPLRESFQGGLATIYLTNTVLAVLAVFKANERGQSPVLWAVKTFSVGGLALDQLTQLPTLEQVKDAKAKKGKRALKNKKY